MLVLIKLSSSIVLVHPGLNNQAFYKYIYRLFQLKLMEAARWSLEEPFDGSLNSVDRSSLYGYWLSTE